eukprot:8600507-Alexandrium_andersonii.AAC.1
MLPVLFLCLLWALELLELPVLPLNMERLVLLCWCAVAMLLLPRPGVVASVASLACAASVASFASVVPVARVAS